MGNDAKYVPERNQRQLDPTNHSIQKSQVPHYYNHPLNDPYHHPSSNYPNYALPSSSSFPSPYYSDSANMPNVEPAPYALSPYRSSPTKVTILPYQGYENYSYKPHGREFPQYTKTSYSNYPSKGGIGSPPRNQINIQQASNNQIYNDYPPYSESMPQYNDKIVYHAPRLVSRTIIPVEESSMSRYSQYPKAQFSEPQAYHEERIPSRYSKLETLNPYPITSQQRLLTPSRDYAYKHLEPYRVYRIDEENRIDRFTSPQAYSNSKSKIISKVQQDKNQVFPPKNVDQDASTSKIQGNSAYFKNSKKNQGPI